MSPQEESLILIAEPDRQLCSAVSVFLTGKGFKTALAYDSFQAIEMLELLNPHVIIANLKTFGENGTALIRTAEHTLKSIPVIVTIEEHDTDAAERAIQQGAYDYLIKPYQYEMLYQKIDEALSTTKLRRENFMLNDLVSLHDVTSRLTATHNLEELLDITFQFCLQASGATGGALQLIDKENEELVTVRQTENSTVLVRSPLNNKYELELSKWVVSRGRSLLIVGQETIPSTRLQLKSNDSSTLCVPIKISGDTIGVISLSRTSLQPPFSLLERHIIEVLASQAGIAINNANLYASINQKLDELMLISNFSEQLTGLVDRTDVIRCLFETAIKHVPVDFMGFLVVQRRTHEFLHWSKGMVDEETLRTICKETVLSFNTAISGHIHERKVQIRRLQINADCISALTDTPFLFKYIVPVCWEELKFGAIFFGASKELPNVHDKQTILASLVSQTRIALTNSKLYSDMKENYIRTIKALAIAVDAKDTYTHGHSENVMNIAEDLAREMGIDEKQVGSIRDAGLLHDIGKIGIPGYILNKPGPLTYEEFNGIMKTHSTLGANIVKDVPFLHDLHQLILYHHEHYNGGGYPDGLKGELIPVGARIIHVADAFEAMTSNRPYRNSLGKKEAVRRLVEGKGKQFDPSVIDAFLMVARRKGWLDDDVTF